MVGKSRLTEKELYKRLDPSKIEIGADIGPIGRITTLKGARIHPKDNNDTDQRSDK
jgi:hypothetical protein